MNKKQNNSQSKKQNKNQTPKKKKAAKPRPDKYEDKLAIEGSFEDVIEASMSPAMTRIDSAKVPTKDRLFEVSVFQGVDTVEIRTFEVFSDHSKILPQLTEVVKIARGKKISPDVYKIAFQQAQQFAQTIK